MYCRSLISKLKVPCMPITCFIFSLFPLYAIFSVHSLDHVYTHYHPNWGSKCTHQQLKNGHILLKNLLLTPIFQDDGHLYANCLFYVLSFCLKCLIFQFLNRDRYPNCHPNRDWKWTHQQLNKIFKLKIWSLISNMTVSLYRSVTEGG